MRVWAGDVRASKVEFRERGREREKQRHSKRHTERHTETKIPMKREQNELEGKGGEGSGQRSL